MPVFQAVSNRYIDKVSLHRLLLSLFPEEDWEIEVKDDVWMLHIPRKLTEVENCTRHSDLRLLTRSGRAPTAIDVIVRSIHRHRFHPVIPHRSSQYVPKACFKHLRIIEKHSWTREAV